MLKNKTKMIAELMREEIIVRIGQTNLTTSQKEELVDKIRKIRYEKATSKSTRILATAWWKELKIEIYEQTENLKSDIDLAEIIRHENCHVFANNYFKKCVGHSAKFKDACAMLGYGRDIGKSTINVQATDEYQNELNKQYKYKSVCCECGKTTNMFKRKVDRTGYRSGCCKAKIEVVAI